MTAIQTYLKNVDHEYQSGVAKEHAYRPALKALMESFDKRVQAINDGKRIDIGAPDLQVYKDGVLIGIVEAKDIDVSLNKVERTDQMKRYLSFSNVILTDYLEFRWYVNSEQRQKIRIAKRKNGHIESDGAYFDQLESMLRGFLEQHTQTITNARELARLMAGRAQNIREMIKNDLSQETPSPELQNQKAAFEKTLLPEITDVEFADMYAQTIAYGLFAARVNYPSDPMNFSRQGAAWYIPNTNPFLRNLFHDIGFNLGEKITWIVDDLAKVLGYADIDEVLRDFGKSTRQEDPVVHFYEDFLADYDPRLRESRGVYYTPEPVVSYIVRSVDWILREHFGRSDGLMDKDTLILDPATGTGTFLYFVIQHIYEQGFVGLGGAWKSYVREHLLNRIFGFELLMAPYTVAHMKLGMLLQETGYDFPEGRRLGVYLTNTLDKAETISEVMFAQHIAKETNEAAIIKRDKPIMVVLGNPPYSGHSANKGEWIGDLVRDYYFVDGKPLGERNPKWLQDDYVKFIRFGQWRIEQTGEGVLAFITNHGYLDNPTFRGMRQSLMNTFTDIYILDLHGNTKKKETTPDGSKDENVFDIQQGVAVGIFIKQRDKSTPATVYHLDYYGLRSEKYARLFAEEVNNSNWKVIETQSPFYLYIPQDTAIQPEYEKHYSVTDIFPLNGWGIATRKDYLLVDFLRNDLVKRFQDIRSLSSDQALKKYGIKVSKHWDFVKAHKELSPDTVNHVRPVLFRPFDKRYIYYEKCMIERGDHRYNLMSHMFSDNLALITIRRLEAVGQLGHFFATDQLSVLHSISSKEGNFAFPLYLYPEPKQPDQLFSPEDDGSYWQLSEKGRRPNLDPAFVQTMEHKLGLTFVTEGAPYTESDEEHFGPEDILHYAYAVFYSPTYRERYAEFLKIDFPRLPLTSNKALFRSLCQLGRDLVQFHLMKKVNPSTEKIITFPIDGNMEVARGYPKYQKERVYINKDQYFEGISENVWEFYVGGYQVLHKWLKDRRGRTLAFNDIQHYRQVVVALQETMQLMAEIDEVIGEFPIA